MSSQNYYDLIVIGAGSGGVSCARSFAATGAKVAIIEKDKVGGTCVLRGCVPKKLMVYAGRFAHEFEDAKNGYGWQIDAKMHWPDFMKHKHNEMDRLNGIYKDMLEKANVQVIYGQGRLSDKNTVVVGGENYQAENILIATGGHPKRPAGLESAYTSNDILDIEEIPKTLAIIGGGYIALEFASVFNNLGSDVHVFLRGDIILRGMELECAKHLKAQLQQDGITFHENSPVQSATANSIKAGDVVMDNCYVLNATGRNPSIAGLDLDLVGIETKNGAIVINEQLQTSVENIYALGDVVDDVTLTPYAIAQGRALTKKLSGNHTIDLSKDNIPTAVFTTPEFATVGLTEEAAKEQYDIEVYVSKFRPMKFCLPQRDEKTLMKLIVDKKSEKVLGVHMVGKDAAEIIQGFAVALNAGATKSIFDATIGIHPGSAEEFTTMREPRT